MSLRIKKNDLVMVISGDDKGVRGRVLAVVPDKGKAIVEGVNIIKKHQKPRSQQDQGGIVEREAPISISKLMLVEQGGQGRAARFGTRIEENGNKVRVLKIRNESKDITV